MATNKEIWNRCGLVVFDLDGTLYDPAPLKLRMAVHLLWEAARQRRPHLVRVIARLRTRREELAELRTPQFEKVLIEDVAYQMRLETAEVEELATHWLEERPLPYLRACRAPGAAPLFAALKRSGRQVAVLSDYPAKGKLAALGLVADYVVSAVDAEVGLLKPHPRGLETVLALAGRTAEEAVVIGDRADRDGAVAAALGVPFLLRGRGKGSDFHSFGEEIFEPLLVA